MSLMAAINAASGPLAELALISWMLVSHNWQLVAESGFKKVQRHSQDSVELA